MADLTTATTFTRTVQGNKRVVFADVSSAGGTTSDTVHTGLGHVQLVNAWFRSTALVAPGATTVSTAISTVATSGCFSSTVEAVNTLNRINLLVTDVAAGLPGITVRPATASTDAGRVIVTRGSGAVGVPFTVYAQGR